MAYTVGVLDVGFGFVFDAGGYMYPTQHSGCLLSPQHIPEQDSKTCWDSSTWGVWDSLSKTRAHLPMDEERGVALTCSYAKTNYPDSI